ncbi:nucleotide-binding domain-containing protein [Cristinia sonorae]|uniref:Nucleotide-binding domain-containing protein n=1 Tax=Cristinia sonorae TaxID=1940300 RepID=A0A8K0XNA0_9AGAR|nr:nucleotide-binding domain-containing protein [Cristinia sonorae]
MPVVVLGSGIIGLSTAYFLSLPPPSPPQIHIVDPNPDLFRITASGLAGGFLAKDWFAPPVAPLGAFSFDLHRRLARECGGAAKWGWCETEGWSLDRGGVSDNDEGFGGEAGVDLDWLMSGSSRATLLEMQEGTEEEAGTCPKWVRAQPNAFKPITDRMSTAQVDPMRLCEFLLSECLARGVTLHSPARATAIIDGDTVRVVSGDGSETVDIRCESLIVAAGAWTPAVFRTLFPHAPRVPRVNPLAGYSVLVRSPVWKPITPKEEARVCHAVFTSDSSGFSPEVFARAGGEIWLGGLNAKHLPLPPLPSPLVLPPSSTPPPLPGSPTSQIEITRTSLCFRPVSPTGRPIIGQVSPSDIFPGGPSNMNVFLGTAHGPWGISLSLGTGWVLGEMVRGEETSVDVSALGVW